ncbi:hypothetical protein GA0115240_16368 [Streptomyces sp. DvalAA-14]|nr:hypothetical protein GA0115240_16368 [Streptomyces sp. DvalAA-14]
MIARTPAAAPSAKGRRLPAPVKGPSAPATPWVWRSVTKTRVSSARGPGRTPRCRLAPAATSRPRRRCRHRDGAVRGARSARPAARPGRRRWWPGRPFRKRVRRRRACRVPGRAGASRAVVRGAPRRRAAGMSRPARRAGAARSRRCPPSGRGRGGRVSPGPLNGTDQSPSTAIRPTGPVKSQAATAGWSAGAGRRDPRPAPHAPTARRRAVGARRRAPTRAGRWRRGHRPAGTAAAAADRGRRARA